MQITVNVNAPLFKWKILDYSRYFLYINVNLSISIDESVKISSEISDQLVQINKSC